MTQKLLAATFAMHKLFYKRRVRKHNQFPYNQRKTNEALYGFIV